MIDTTYKLIAVPSKLRRRTDTDHRKRAYKNAIEIYHKRDLDAEILDKIIKHNNELIINHERDKEIREISHHLVTSVITNCIRANLMAD